MNQVFLGTDYRGVVAVLDEFAELRDDLGLAKVPDQPTLCHAQKRQLKGGFVVLLFRAAVPAVDRGLIGGKPTAAIDATGLESRHTSPDGAVPSTPPGPS